MANLNITITVTNTRQLEGLESALSMFTSSEYERRKDACRDEAGRSVQKPNPVEWSDSDERAYTGACELLKAITGKS